MTKAVSNRETCVLLKQCYHCTNMGTFSKIFVNCRKSPPPPNTIRVKYYRQGMLYLKFMKNYGFWRQRYQQNEPGKEKKIVKT